MCCNGGSFGVEVAVLLKNSLEDDMAVSRIERSKAMKIVLTFALANRMDWDGASHTCRQYSRCLIGFGRLNCIFVPSASDFLSGISIRKLTDPHFDETRRHTACRNVLESISKH